MRPVISFELSQKSIQPRTADIVTMSAVLFFYPGQHVCHLADHQIPHVMFHGRMSPTLMLTHSRTPPTQKEEKTYPHNTIKSGIGRYDYIAVNPC